MTTQAAVRVSETKMGEFFERLPVAVRDGLLGLQAVCVDEADVEHSGPVTDWDEDLIEVDSEH